MDGYIFAAVVLLGVVATVGLVDTENISYLSYLICLVTGAFLGVVGLGLFAQSCIDLLDVPNLDDFSGGIVFVFFILPTGAVAGAATGAAVALARARSHYAARRVVLVCFAPILLAFLYSLVVVGRTLSGAPEDALRTALFWMLTLGFPLLWASGALRWSSRRARREKV